MPICKKLASNGKPSKLFDGLYDYFSSQDWNDTQRAEQRATSVWLLTHSDDFKGWYGNSTRDENNEPVLKDGMFTNADNSSIDIYETGWVKSIRDRVQAMAADPWETGYGARRQPGPVDKNAFYIHPESLWDIEEGRKTVSIRPKKYETGVYKMGENYYRVTNRGFKMITDLKEKPEELQRKFIGEKNIKHSHIQQFFDGNIPMYVYDIKKVEPKDVVSAMADLVGVMQKSNKDPNASLASGDIIFDNFITAVNDYISRLEEERRRVKGNKFKVDQYTERIDKQKAILKRLTSNQTVQALIEIGDEQMDEVSRFALKPEASLLEQLEGMRISNAWKELTTIIDLTKEGKSPVELLLVEQGIDVEQKAHRLYSTLWNRSKDTIVEAARQNNIDLQKTLVNGEFVFKDIDRFGAETLSADYSTNPLEQLMTAIRQNNLSEYQKEHYDFLKEHDEIKRRLLGSKDADDSFVVERYTEEEMNEDGKKVKVEKEGIISKYSREFTLKHLELRHRAETEGTWKDFYKFEREHYDYDLTEEGKKDWELYAQQIREDHKSFDKDGNEVFDEKAISEKLNRYDPQVFADYLADPKKKVNSGGRWFTKTPKANIPVNPAYKKLTDKQKEYHEWFTTQFAEHHQNSVFDYRMGDTDIDQLLMAFTHDVTSVDRVKRLSNAAVDWLMNTVMVTAGSTKGRVITRTLTGKEHIKGEYKSIVKFLPENGKKIIPSTVLRNFVSASKSFKHKREVEETMNFINDIATIASKREVTNAGAEKTDRAGSAIYSKSRTHISSRVEYTVKQFLSNSAKEMNTTARKDVKPGEKGFSWGQTFDSLNTLTRTRFMALAPLGAAGNFFMGAINNMTYAAGGKYFTDKQLARAVWMMKSSPFKFFSGGVLATKEARMVAEIMYANNIIGDVTEVLNYGETALSKLFILQKGGEFLVQGAATLAQMFNTKVTLKDGKEGNLFDLYKMNEDGRVEVQKELLAADSPFQDDNKIFEFFQKAKAVNEKIHGDYNNPLLAKKTVAGRALMMFRTWLPMSIKERFGREYEHRLLGTQKGRYISVIDLVRNTFSEKGEGGKRIWSMSGDRSLDFVKTIFKLIPGLSHKIKLSDKVSEIDKENINMAVRELQMLLVITMGMVMSKSVSDDDDDETSKNIATYLYNQGERLQSELSFYYTPSSFDQLFKSIIPLTSTLIDAHKLVKAGYVYATGTHDDDLYKRGFRKGHSKFGTAVTKFLPLTRSAQSVWSAMSERHDSRYSK